MNSKKSSGPRVWTVKTYNRVSRYYDVLMKFFFPIGEKARKRIVEKLAVGAVLDVACGTGTLLEMAQEKGLQCYGLDLSDGMLAQAKSKVCEAKLVQASYYEIPYQEASFDYVVATNALSGGYINVRKALREMIRVCRNNGWIYIGEWPKAEKDTIKERLVVWLASLNDDAPKNYLKIFSEMGYEPEVEILSNKLHIYGIRKSYG